MILFFFFNDTATTEIYTLSLHDALPISPMAAVASRERSGSGSSASARSASPRSWSTAFPDATSRRPARTATPSAWRSEEHTSELQSRQYLVCRLLLEKKKKINYKLARIK